MFEARLHYVVHEAFKGKDCSRRSAPLVGEGLRM
jgi:hypothetical protein